MWVFNVLGTIISVELLMMESKEMMIVTRWGCNIHWNCGLFVICKISFQKRWGSMEGVEEDNKCLALVYICGHKITCISNIC
jgi:hypothetical protein